MEQTQLLLNIDRRNAVDPNDIETRTALFRQHVEGLIRRNLYRFSQICEERNLTGDSVGELKEGLVQLFANETHYKRRNKLTNQVSQG